MSDFRNPVYPILYNGAPFLVTPIGDKPITTFLVDLEQVFVLLEKHEDPEHVAFYTEFGKGITDLSTGLGRVIEERNKDTQAIW